MSAPGDYVGQELDALGALVRYQSWIVGLFGEAARGRILEVGAGLGAISAHLARRADELVLLEPDERMAARLGERFGRTRGVSVVAGELSAAHDAHPAWTNHFDAVVSVNVLEHVVDDRALVARMARLVRPGGHVLTFAPALPFLFGSLDEHVGHVRRYTRSTIVACHEAAGLQVDSVRYVDSLGALPWFIAGRVIRRRGFDGPAALVYDAVGVPIARRLDRLTEQLFGKNIVVTARRGADEGRSR